MEDFRLRVLQLSSSVLDAASPLKRSDYLDELLSEVSSDSATKNEKERVDRSRKEPFLVELGIGGLGVEAANQCYSLHAWKRVASLLQAAIRSCLSEQHVDNTVNVCALCHALCHLICKSRDLSLLESVASSLVHNIIDQSLRESLSDAFGSLAKQWANNDSNRIIAFPALSLASTLATSPIRAGEEWLDIFLEATSLQSKSTNFPQPDQVALAKMFLLKCVTQTLFDKCLAPILGLKMRAHPESVMALAEVILSFIFQTSNHKAEAALLVDGYSQLNTEGGNAANLLPSTIKHFKSSKAEMRWLASRILIILAKSSRGKRLFQSVITVTETVCDALSVGTVATSLTTSDLRAGAYLTLEGISDYIIRNLSHVEQEQSEFYEEDICTIVQLADKVLSELVMCLPKDKSNTTSSLIGLDGIILPALVAREIGINALISWMYVHTSFSKYNLSTKALKGYDRALDYFADPVLKYSSKDVEFRLRIGSLIMPPSIPYFACGRIEPLVIQSYKGETFFEPILVELIDKKNIKGGLEKIVEMAYKKHQVSQMVAQIDGALAVFIFCVYANSKPSFIFPPSILKHIRGVSLTKKLESSFLYSQSILDLAKTDVLLNYVLHRIVALFSKTPSESENRTTSGKEELLRIMKKQYNEEPIALVSISPPTRALAVCASNPLVISTKNLSAYSSVSSSLKTVVAHSSAEATNALSFAFFYYINECSLKNEDIQNTINTSQLESVDETFNKLPTCNENRECLSENASHKNIRHMIYFLLSTASDSDAMWLLLLLMHTGTSMHSNRKQRMLLVNHTLDALKERVLPFVEKCGSDAEPLLDRFARFIAFCATAAKFCSQVCEREHVEKGNEPLDAAKDLRISRTIHEAALSLITTLGGLAGSFDIEADDPSDEEKKPYAFVAKVCIDLLPKYLVSDLSETMQIMEFMTQDDIALYRCTSIEGMIFQNEDSAMSSSEPAIEKKKDISRKTRGVPGGFNMTEDEEWEKQVKKDLALKKSQGSHNSVEKSSSYQDKELLAQKTFQKDKYSQILKVRFPRVLSTIRCLCQSDIEVGNALLPKFGMIVIRATVSTCVAITSSFELQKDCFDTLAVLAACVYEIDETHANTLARSLAVSFRCTDVRSNCEVKGELDLTVQALPSPCPAAACTIFEMDNYGECLSGNSFMFLFPIIRAALSGPRNVPGCDAALTVLNRHFTMLAVDDKNTVVKSLRKDMALAILELLSHDRSQTFVNPTPYEALIGCYVTDEESDGPALTASEIGPLVNGALGNENQRVASMETFECIALHHPKLIMNNPLVESRIWLNCHGSQDRIKMAARKAWLICHGRDMHGDINNIPIDPPSKMYAIPLIPLLSHENTSVSLAAAASMSYAMGMHTDSVEKNILKLCNLFIESLTVPAHEEKPMSTPLISAQTSSLGKTTTKKVIDTA